MLKKFLLPLFLTLFLFGCVGAGGSSSNTPSSTTQLTSNVSQIPVGLSSFSLAVNGTVYTGTFESNVRDGNVIQVNLPLNAATALNQNSLPLIATFSTVNPQDTVTVNGVTQVSGSTPNNFWYKVIYTVSAPGSSSVSYTVYALGWNTISANTPWANSSDTYGFTAMALDSSGDIFVGGWQQSTFGFDDGSIIQVYNASTGTWGGGPAGDSPFSDDRNGVSTISAFNNTSAYIGTAADIAGGHYYYVTRANTTSPNSHTLNSFSAWGGNPITTGGSYFASEHDIYPNDCLSNSDIPCDDVTSITPVAYTSITSDASGNIWVGGGGYAYSLQVFDQQTQSLLQYAMPQYSDISRVTVVNGPNQNIYGASFAGTIEPLSLSNNNTIVVGSPIYTNQNVYNACASNNKCVSNISYDSNDNLFFPLFILYQVEILGTPVVDTSGNTVINALPIPPVSLLINPNNSEYIYLFDNTYNNVVTMGTDNNIYWLHFPLAQPN